MKTVYSAEYSNRYDVLFQDALETLKNIWTNDKALAESLNLTPWNEEDNNKEKFESLEDYFTHIGDLAKLHSDWVTDPNKTTRSYDKYSRFLMLPMDEVYNEKEGLFTIDPNSRSINVPNNFKKNGVSLSGDELAETLIFEIDRFFDVTDLTTTDIFVQWINPAGQAGVSKITMIDYNMKPRKIVFGWPLTTKVTGSEGKLQFAVRFQKKNSENVITYSLNTIPTSVEIKRSLDIDWERAEVDDPSHSFATVIENGPISGAPDAAMPQFEYPLPRWSDLNDEETLPLSASMLTYDSGTLSYELLYTPTYIENDETVTKDTVSYPVIIEPIITKDIKAKANKRYYKDAGQGYYELVAFAPDETIEGVIYEKHGVYEVFWDAVEHPHVTGSYKFKVVNNVSRANPAEVESSVLVIPTVDNKSIKFDTALPTVKMLEVENVGESLVVAASAKVKQVDAVPAENQACDIAYQWQYKAHKDDGFVINDSVTTPVYADAAPGYYQVIATASRNKEQCSIKSEICRVVNPIIAPKIDHLSTAEPDSRDPKPGEIATFTVELLSTYDDLTSDKVEYIWYRNRPENNGVPVSINDPDIASIDENSLTVISIKDIQYYYCVVRNHLGDQTADTQSGLYIVI